MCWVCSMKSRTVRNNPKALACVEQMMEDHKAKWDEEKKIYETGNWINNHMFGSSACLLLAHMLQVMLCQFDCCRQHLKVPHTYISVCLSVHLFCLAFLLSLSLLFVRSLIHLTCTPDRLSKPSQVCTAAINCLQPAWFCASLNMQHCILRSATLTVPMSHSIRQV